MVLLEKLEIHSGLDIKAVGEAEGHQLYQIAVADLVLAEQDKMGEVAIVSVALVETASGGEVDLASDDRLDPLCLASVVELYRSVHYAVVGDRYRSMTCRLCRRRYFFYSARAVKHTVFGMQMQMYEFGHFQFLSRQAGKTRGK